MFTIPMLSYSLIHKKESNDLRCSTKKNSNLINKDVKRHYILNIFLNLIDVLL
jgi:hypothetical protein